MSGHKIIIATFAAGQVYGTSGAGALTSQIKAFFPNLWFGLLVGVAAGLPNLCVVPARDIRLGDVLVGLSDNDNPGLFSYDLGKETKDRFQPRRSRYTLTLTAPMVALCGSIGSCLCSSTT